MVFMRTLTDGYQLENSPGFSPESGIIELPYVRTEGNGRADKFYSAQLQLTDTGLYELKQLSEIAIADFSMLNSMPYYSYDTGILELPVLSNATHSTPRNAYTAQLKYRSTKADKIYFKLLYSKVLE